jgi:RHS repeat-associated protein
VCAGRHVKGLKPAGAAPVAFAPGALDPAARGAGVAVERRRQSLPQTVTFDANGNLTSDGSRTFEWDARNELVAVTEGDHRSEFSYDALQRRTREIEKEGDVVTSDVRVLWCGEQPCDERSSDGASVVRRMFWWGEETGVTATFFARDHLSSVRDVTNDTDAVIARYSFDSFGRRTLSGGNDVTRLGFSGDRWHESSGLWLTQYRPLDVQLGPWAAEDPLGFKGGSDFYAYSWNNPIRFIDPFGLKPASTWSNWYGNYCGPGGSGSTKDGLDVACQHHHSCYDTLGLGGIGDAMSVGSDCKQNCDHRLCQEASDFHPTDFESARAKILVMLIFCRSRVPIIRPPDMLPSRWNPM